MMMNHERPRDTRQTKYNKASHEKLLRLFVFAIVAASRRSSEREKRKVIVIAAWMGIVFMAFVN